MKSENEILDELRNVFDTVKANYHKSGPIAARQQGIKRAIDEIKELVKDDKKRTELDQLFSRVSEALSSENALANTIELLKKRDDFVKFEQPMKSLMAIRDKELKKVLDSAAEALPDVESIEELKEAVPTSTEAFLNSLELHLQKASEVLYLTKDMPRREKKAAREDEKSKIWALSMGTALSIGNVLLSLTGLGASVATASITAGAGVVGSTVLKK